MKHEFNLKNFLYEVGDGPEFVLCDICRFNKHNSDGERVCLKKNSAADENPTEMYLDICKQFRGPSTPIEPWKFAELMKNMVTATPAEPGITYADSVSERRYNMEYLMCVMLEMLGYGEGAKIFLDQGFELPF